MPSSNKSFFTNVETQINLNTEQPLLLLVNSVGTYESIHMKELSCKGNDVVYKFYLNPSVSAAGPLDTPRNTRIGCQTPSAMNVYAGATYTSFGLFLGTQLPEDLIIDQGFMLLVTATGPMNEPVSVLASWNEKR